MMRQVAVESNNDETEAKATGWRRTYNRAMARMTTVAQRWAKAMADMKVAIGTATSSLMSWRNDMGMANEIDGSDRASTGQCISKTKCAHDVPPRHAPCRGHKASMSWGQ